MLDRPYLRLASFALLLIVIFGVAIVAGRLYGPDMSTDEPTPRHDAMRTNESEHP